MCRASKFKLDPLRSRSGPPLLWSAPHKFCWHSAWLFRVIRDTGPVSWHSALSFIVALPGPRWTCSAGTQLCSHVLSRMELSQVRHVSWTTHWVNTLCWLSLLDSTSDPRSADLDLWRLLSKACRATPRKSRGESCRFFQSSSVHSPSTVGLRHSIDPHCSALFLMPVLFPRHSCDRVRSS